MIWFDKLAYVFQWTEFVITVDFKEVCHKYITDMIDNSIIVDVDMPTSLLNKKTIGEWTLKNALDVDDQKKMFFASNFLDHVAVIKIIERIVKNHHNVNAEM